MGQREEELRDKIRQLIALQKEGDYWDFKEMYGDNASLVHDIICLANTISHKGDRYLIYGVTDSCEVVGVPDGAHKKQADVIDLLRNVPFANIHPDIYLDTIEIDKKSLDVITIKDDDNKPYFLEKAYQCGKIYLYPGTIYTRKRDANTPKNCSASFHDVEYLWKHRFGIDLTGIERVKFLMKNPDDWEYFDSCRSTELFHKYFPEYKIKYLETEMDDFSEPYIHCYPNNKASSFNVDIYYHTTRLIQQLCVCCDGGRVLMPVPDVSTINDNLFYYFVKDSIRYILYQIMLKTSCEHTRLSKNLINPYIMTFSDENSLDSYREYAIKRIPQLREEDVKPFHRNPKNGKFAEHIKFIDKCIFTYCEWNGTDFTHERLFI